MKKVVVAILLFFLATIAVAQEQSDQPKILPLQAQCSFFTDMAETLGKYEEQLLFTGEGMSFGFGGTPYRGGMMFFVNQDTGTWSVVQLFADGMACLVFNGSKFEPYVGQQR